MNAPAFIPMLLLLLVALAGASKDKNPPEPLALSKIPTSQVLDIASSAPSDVPSDIPSTMPSSAPTCKGKSKGGTSKSSKGGDRRRRNLSSEGKKSKSSKRYLPGDECHEDAYDEVDSYSYQSAGSATCGTVVAAAGAIVAAALI